MKYLLLSLCLVNALGDDIDPWFKPWQWAKPLEPRQAGSPAAPVVIVPGDGSNQLQARIDKPSTVSWKCAKKWDWFTLWLDLTSLLALTDCWADNIKLIYDEEKDTLTNNVGVETR